MISSTSGGVTTSLRQPVSIGNLAVYARSTLDMARRTDIRDASTTRMRLPNLMLTVHSLDAEMTRAMRCNVLQASGPFPAPATPELTVMVLHGDAPGRLRPAPWAPDQPYMPHQVAQVLAGAGLQGSYFHDLDNWHLLDPGNGFAVHLFRHPGGYPPWETGAPLRPFLHWHYASHGARLAHSGTLGLGGTGVLLAGAGGSGKSGTVVAGLMHGLQSVGDDYVLLDSAAGPIHARPLYATLKQDPAGFGRLGLAARLPTPGPLNWQGKHQFRIQDLAPDAVPEALRITALLVPRITGGSRTRIVSIPRAEAMMALAASSIYQMPGERESGFRFFSQVARQLPCLTLELGRDPAEIAGRIGDFISGMRP